MRTKIIAAAVLIVFLAAGVFGMEKKQTYTDFVSQPDYMDKLHVALLREKNVVSNCKGLKVGLPQTPIILKVKCVGEREYVFQAGQQLVQVEKVFQGSELIEEEEIYLYSEHWTVILWSYPNSAELSFVNVMEPGEEYLVFLSGKKVKVPGSDIAGYEVFSDYLIRPIFLYGEREHTAVKLSEDLNRHTYVQYRSVKGNEMFADTTAGYEAWMELKEMLFEMYGEGGQSNIY